MEEELIFVGYRQFTSKNNNVCNVLDFITKPKNRQDGKVVYTNNVSVFTTDEKYHNFITNVKILSTVKIPFEIVGNKVKYSI